MRLIKRAKNPSFSRMIGLKNRIQTFEQPQGGVLYLLTPPPFSLPTF